MFRHLIKTIDKQIVRNATTAPQKSQKWDILAAICLERKPTITQPLNQLEKDYKQMLSEVEFERSLKSDHELRHEKEIIQIEKMKKGDDVEVHIKETAQEQLDAATEELKKFSFASRVTPADEKNDVKSLDRKLDKHLVCVIKQKVGKDEFFMLPQGMHQDGETLRQTANRVLKDVCGENVKAIIYGNAPSGIYKYKYPKSVQAQNNTVGAKVFIYFARYQKGQVQNEKGEFKWLDRTELEKTLPQQYQKSVLNMLIDE